MTSSTEGNVFGEVKDRWINPLYTEGVGRRTGRQLQINAGRDSEGFENFSDYWSDSAADSDISEFVGKENDTSQAVTDGTGRKYTEAINRKLSSPLKAMQSFSSVSTKSGDPSTSSGITGRLSTGSTLSTRSSGSVTVAGSLEHTDEPTSANQKVTEQATEDMTEVDHAVQDEDKSSEDLDVSGHVEKTNNVTEQVTPPLQESLNEADVTGSIIAVRANQAPNSALQVFKTKKRLSFSTNEVDDAKSTKNKTPNKEKKRQPTRGKSTNDKPLQKDEEEKSKNSDKPVRKSPRHKKGTDKSSEEDTLDSTLTSGSQTDSETPTKGKGSSEEEGQHKKDTSTKISSPNRRSTRRKIIVDDENNENQEDNRSEKDGPIEKGEAETMEEDGLHENDKDNNPDKTDTLCISKPTQQFHEDIDDSANASRFLTIHKSNSQTVPAKDSSHVHDEVEEELEGEIEIVEEPEVISRRNMSRRESKAKGKKTAPNRKGINKRPSSKKAQSEDEDEEKSSESQTSGDASNSTVDQDENEDTEREEETKRIRSKRGATNKNKNKSVVGRKQGAGDNSKETMIIDDDNRSETEKDIEADEQKLEADEQKLEIPQSKPRRNKRSKQAAKEQKSMEVKEKSHDVEEVVEEQYLEKKLEEEEVTSKPLRKSTRGAKGKRKQVRSQKGNHESVESTKKNEDEAAELTEKMEEVEEAEDIPPKKSRRNARSNKNVEPEEEVETASGRGRNKKTKKMGGKKRGPVNNRKKSNKSSEDEKDVDNADDMSDKDITTHSTTLADLTERNGRSQDRQSTTPKVFELVQLAESMEQHNEPDKASERTLSSKSQTSSSNEDGDIVTVKKNINFSSRIESPVLTADDDQSDDEDNSDIVININGVGSNHRISWQKTPSQLSPIKIDSYLEDYVNHDSDKAKTSKRNNKKQSKADKKSKVSKKAQTKGKKGKKDVQFETEAAKHTESGSGHEEIQDTPSTGKSRQQPRKRRTEPDKEEDEPERKVQRPSPKQSGRKSQSPRTRSSSSSGGKTNNKKPSPKGWTPPDNSVYDCLDTEPSADMLESDSSQKSTNSSTDSDDGRRASCVMKMGATGTTVVTVHAKSEEDEETDDSSSTPITVTSAEPTPKSILKKSGKKGRLTNKRLTLQFFEVPKKKGFIVKPEKTPGLRRTERTRCQTLEYWRNERPLYERRKSGGFALVGIKSPINKTPAVKKTKARTTKKKRMLSAGQTPSNVSMHVTPPPKAKQVPHTAVTVINPETQEEVEIDAVITSDMHKYVGPSGKVAEPDDPISVCKCLHQQAFSSGILKVRGLREKSRQLVKRNTMVFYIVHGKLSVTIHNTTQILQTGDTFFVPQGNVYSIQNLRKDEAKIKFFQLKNG